MEEKIGNFSRAMASFCKDLHSNCNFLNLALSRRPIPVDSAAATFVEGLNRRVKATGSDLNMLESMACGTISFEELLGHCNELYKKNQSNLADLEAHLRSFGYEPGMEDKDELLDVEAVDVASPMIRTPESLIIKAPYSCGLDSFKKNIEQDALLGSSLSFDALGISEASLSRLDAADDHKIASHQNSFQRSISYDHPKPQEKSISDQPQGKVFLNEGTETQHLVSFPDNHQLVGSAVKNLIEVSKDAYESLPSHIKGLASWENLQEAITKINLKLSEQVKPKRGFLLSQDDFTSIGLGTKGKAYLLQLLRLNWLVVETGGSSTTYRVVDDTPL